MRSLRAAAALLVSIAQASDAKADAIDDFIRGAMARERTPGLVLAIASAKQGEVIRPYGQANLEHLTPVRPETIFQSGSTGKQFTLSVRGTGSRGTRRCAPDTSPRAANARTSAQGD